MINNALHERDDLDRIHQNINYLISNMKNRYFESHHEDKLTDNEKFWLNFEILHRKELFWSFYVIQTRCFYWGVPSSRSEAARIDVKNLAKSTVDNQALVPLADLFNHNCQLGTSKAGLNTDNNCFEICCHNENGYEKDQQAYVKYGDHDSEKLVLNYGFFNVGYKNLENKIYVTISDVENVLNSELARDQTSDAFSLWREYKKRENTTQIQEFRRSYIQQKLLDIGAMFASDGPSWSLQMMCVCCLFNLEKHGGQQYRQYQRDLERRRGENEKSHSDEDPELADYLRRGSHIFGAFDPSAGGNS